MENNLTVEEILKNVKDVISLYGEIVDELIGKIETSNTEYERLKKENEKMLRELVEKKGIEDECRKYRREIAELKQSRTKDTSDKTSDILSGLDSRLCEIQNTLQGLAEKVVEKEQKIEKDEVGDSSTDGVFDPDDDETWDNDWDD